MIYKLCRRCKKAIEHPNVYCDECQVIADEKKEQLQKDRDSKYNKTRDPKYKAFYNSTDWKLLKDKKMQNEEYRCELCKKLATEVHHIKPIQIEEWWQFRLDYDNLEALCVDCHNARHDRFRKRKKVMK